MVTKEVAYLPSAPGVDNFRLLVEEFSKFDMVIIQRCYLREIVNTVRMVTEYLNIPLVFETDDDYLNIPIDNPAYLSMIPPPLLKENSNNPHKIEELRQRGLDNYREIISMMDGVIVSTEELKRTLYPYNKNIHVLENNVEESFAYRSYDPEHLFIENGQVTIPNNMGMVTIPAYVQADNKKISPTPRIGWSSTVTHWGQDFDSVKKHWGRVIDKYSESCWFVYIGWDRFVQWHTEYAGFKPGVIDGKPAWVPDETKRQLPRRVLHIPDSMYDLYMFHLRNLDIGIAPLSPNVFNMSKSDIKAVEYGAWKIPAILPRFHTYKRHWKDGENCLMYSNGPEFEDAMSTLINDHDLRFKLGNAAHKYVSEHRLERHHAKERYGIYCSFLEGKSKLKTFQPLPEFPK